MTGNQAGGFASALATFTAADANANAESSASTFKANQLLLDSQVSSLQAQSTLQAGNMASGLVGKKVASAIGQERASYAAQGVNVDTGSAASTQESTNVQGALEEQTIQSNAWREAWGLRVQSENEKMESEMMRLEGKEQSFNTLMTGGMKAINDIESGFYRSDVASS